MLCVFLLYAAVSLNASADSSLLQLDSIDAKFRGFQNSWYAVVKGFAQGLFWKLVLIDFGWTAIIYLLEKNDFAEVLSSLLRKVFTVGFFFALLKMSDSWIPAIIQSFITIGKAASGVGDLTPDGIVNKGLDLALGAFETLKGLGVTEKIVVVFPVTFMALLIFLAFLWVAAQLLVTLVESYIAIGLGVILLGFGGSRWTTDFATKYLQFAVGTGIKLMLLYAIVGGGQTLFSGLLIDPEELIKSCMVILGVSFVFTYLAINIPQLSASMMSGSPNMTAGGLAGAAATVAGAAVGAGAAAVATGAAAAGGVRKGCCRSSGLHHVEWWFGFRRRSREVRRWCAGSCDRRGCEPRGWPRGRAASGTAQSARSAFADKVGQSAGGKIASSIEASRGGSVAGVPARRKRPPQQARMPGRRMRRPAIRRRLPLALARPPRQVKETREHRLTVAPQRQPL
ncbi:hypothetical protein AU476_17820 [Cupriavidus sp. UYMSc13B]|nr:hypothetical protein AU476_17820 [Cupriavidus sp. UYMSc13B]